MKIGFAKNGISLKVESDIANGQINICDNDVTEEQKEAPDSDTNLTKIQEGSKNVVQVLSELSLTDKLQQEYSLKYINIFNKGATFSPIIKIHLSGGKKGSKKSIDEPMIMEFKIGKVGQVKYFLAPKINEH